MADEHDLTSTEFGEAAHDGFILAEITVPAQRHEFVESVFDVIPEMRT